MYRSAIAAKNPRKPARNKKMNIREKQTKSVETETLWKKNQKLSKNF
jgi:hypothetical protein